MLSPDYRGQRRELEHSRGPEGIEGGTELSSIPRSQKPVTEVFGGTAHSWNQPAGNTSMHMGEIKHPGSP